jgi:tetrapyrrole methylase family protein/MazG family protein
MHDAESFKSAIASIVKIQSIASEVGFDWPDAISALPKVPEEAKEIEEALKSNNKERIEEEIGDLLFASLNVARLAGVDAEKCLRAAGNKFITRFDTVEKMAEADGGFEGKSLEQLDVYWNKAKKEEQ